MATTPLTDSEQITKELEALIKQLEVLKSSYDQYFQGVKKEEPLKLRNEVQERVRKLSGTTIQNATIKFKLTQTISRYNTFNQHWSRILKEMEEGRYKRDLFLAKLHEAERQAAMKQGEKEPKGKSAVGAPPASPLDTLFNSFLDARKKCGESNQGITKEKFQQTLTQQTEALKGKIPAGKKLQFKVVIENGKSKIKAFV